MAEGATQVAHPSTDYNQDGNSLDAKHSTPSAPRVRKITDPHEWDRTLLSAENAGLLQSWRWGEFKRQAGWSPARLRLEDHQQPVMAAQILFRKLPRLPLPVSIAYIPRGPVHFSGNEQPAHTTKTFWRAIHAEARRQGAIFLKVEPNITLEGIARTEMDGNMSRLGFHPAGRLQPARTIVLDITQNEEDLLKAMKPKTRYNLRLAERRGVQVRRAASADDLCAFYSLLAVTSARDEFGVHAFAYYEELWRIFGPEGDNTALLLLADHPDEQEWAAGPIAGLLAMRFGREVVYMYGASADRGREHMPNYLLQWEAIKWARESGCRVYDFWGIPDPPDEEGSETEVSPINARSGLRGVYWFKKGFGGREIEYPGAYDYVYNSLLYKIWLRWRGANLG